MAARFLGSCRPAALAAVLALALILAFSGGRAHAVPPPAGTVIGNQATATYNDAVGTPRTSTSNLVQTTVTQVKSFTLTADGARTAAAGQTVYYPHTLTNTGNGTDTYTLNAPVAGGAFTHTGLVYYVDADGNGVPDNFVPVAGTGPLAMGGVFRFVVAGTVPIAATNGQTGTITISVSDTAPATLTNLDTTTVSNSAVSVTKAISVTSGASPNAGPITVSLAYTNTGTAAATNLELRDLLPAGMTYIAASGRWSVSGATALDDLAGGDPAGISYDFGQTQAGRVTAVIASVAAGASGALTFTIQIAPGLAPGFINNTAQFQTATQGLANTNTSSYQVLRSAGVVANGSTTDSTNGAAEPVTIAAAAAGASLTFTNVVWNTGNAADQFVVALAGQPSWPAGSIFTLLQADGVTPLIANTTPSIPVYAAGCPAGFETDATPPTQQCGYRVVLRVQLPIAASGGPYSVTKTATSAFDNTKSDTVVDTLTAVTANAVDVTNGTARADSTPAGTAAAANAATTGFGATGTTVITTNTVTPVSAATTVTRFLLYVNNAGAVNDSFDLTVAGTPAGWTVQFRADGGAGNCSTVGAALTGTGPVNAGANRLVCAEVTVPTTISGQAAPGNYDLDFTATSALNAAVTDVKRDRVTIPAVNLVTLTPNGAQSTFAGVPVTYTHTISNLGNVAETISFAAGFLLDSRAGQGWTSAAYLDGNGNGVFDPGVDDVPANLISIATTFPLAVNASRAIFVRVNPPGSALASDPPNVTTLTARYNAGAASVAATDTTTISAGLVLLKEQVAVPCAAPGPHAGYSTAPISAGAATAPGQCVAYRITATNVSGGALAAVVVNDVIPANTRQRNSCGAPASTIGVVASPGDGNAGTVSANVGALAAAQSATITFCVRIDVAGPPAGTVIPNQATATATAGVTPLTATSNQVSLTVGGGAGGGYAAVLAANGLAISQPGATVFFNHTLTNTGTLADLYTLSTTDLAVGFTFVSVTMYPDANGDGVPDSLVPLVNPIALVPGQVFRFIVRVVVPAGVPLTSEDDVRIDAASAGGALILPNVDRVRMFDPALQPDCAAASKFISQDRGPSPGGPVTITLTYNACDQARSKLHLSDPLPPGMRYVPGSARWNWAPGVVLTDGDASDSQGGAAQRIVYDFGVTQANTATAMISNIAAQAGGSLTFQVEIVSGLVVDTIVENSAIFVFYDASGKYGFRQSTNAVTYRVTGTSDLELRGERLRTATPGAPAVFTNVLTNRGDATDTFDITLAGSTFPSGTVFTLFKPDGVTALADTDGNGTPDTGPVAPGGSYSIVVKVLIPETAAPGAYKVTKTARSARSPLRSASADDSVDTLEERCTVSLDPDNQALTGYGRHVTYTHFLRNRGNCGDTVVAGATYLGNSRPGWTSTVYADNPVAGGVSIPGTPDATDVVVSNGWSMTLVPGQVVRILVDVLAPTEEQLQSAAKRGGKSVVDSNVTTLTLTSGRSGPLIVHDTTIIDDSAVGTDPQNVIRNFTNDSYGVPTLWAVLGRNAYLRADARSCNASDASVETRQVVITGPGGESETVTATETGPATGVFVVPALAVRSPPVAAGDRILQGRANDVFEMEILGCGQRIAGVFTIMDAAGVVFDSRTNAPVAGASVTLLAASGGQCTTTPVASSAITNPATTGSDGRYRIGDVSAGDYCLSVAAPNGYAFRSRVPWTELAAGRNLVITGLATGGSYGDPFRQSDTGGIVVDLPVDPVAQSGLFVQKAASRFAAEVGEFVDYTVRVKNNTGNALDRAAVEIADDLPAGFAFVPGTARRDGVAIADPAVRGPRLVLLLGPMSAGQEIVVTYRARLGPGSMQGDGVNRVQASYVANGIATRSNIATARVQVTGGVFSDRGYILGKVFLDCNANGVQDAGEKGVPGMRIFLEDGTYAITDGGGKYNFYGISNRTHVLKVDSATLPRGAKLAVISSRQLGDAKSRIVDLQAGELHRGDFAIAGCEAGVVSEVEKRSEALKRRADEMTAIAGAPLATEPRPPVDVKALPASGVVSLANGNGPTGAPALGDLTGTTYGPSPVLNVSPTLPLAAAARDASPAPAASAPPLEALVPGLDKTLGFIGLKDGDTLPYAQAPIRVKGVAGATFQLSANGVDVPEARVGKRSVLAEHEVQAWEYVGVDLKPGENTLLLVQRDAFGNERGRESIRVTAPGRLGRLAIELPPGGGLADGLTAVKVIVKLTDASGVPVSARTAVTLEASRGAWQVQDLDPVEPGIQVMIEGGHGEFALVPTLEPGTSLVVATSGRLKAEAKLDFLPELRELIAAGVIEGAINIRRLDSRALVPTRSQDGFEQELRHLSRTSGDGKRTAGARAAFFLKGKIRGEYLLTAAYDSDKDTRERLFRDIQPDEFYPVYGDSAVRGYDAQSTSKLYVRIDHRKSYLLWGDFTTLESAGVRKLSGYSRSLTGARGHWESGNIVANFFASRDTTRQAIEELRANGTSGPYQLASARGLVNSEKVEIITRDRNQPSIVIATVPLARFVDYEIEALTGRLLFKAPVPSVDANINPRFIRVTYEVDQGGNEFWVAGGDVTVKLARGIEVGASYAEDRNPSAPFKLKGAHAVVALAERTVLTVEGARTERPDTVGTGDAGRVHLRHESERFKAEAFVARTDPSFDNPGAYLGQGRGEAGARAAYKLDDRTTLKAEALRTEDRTNHNVRDGYLASAEHTFENKLALEVGVRHAREPDGQAFAAPGVDPAFLASVPREVTSARARLSGPVPQLAGATVYGEVEVDIQDADRKILALGGDYALANRGKLYFRHEFISSLTGPYGLANQQRQNATVFGLDTDYMKDGRLFSEYRIHDALSGGDAEAAIGLRNLWTLAEGLRLGTSVERVHAFSGAGQNENTAVAAGLEYTASPLWKATTRVELRDASTSESALFTLGFASRLARDWTFLGRNVYSIQRNKGGDRDGAERVIERLQAGVAFRDNETNKVNALARVEHREERDNTQPGIALKRTTELFSVNADFQPRRPFVLSGRYAAKWTNESSNGLATKYRAQLLGGRASWEFAPKWDLAINASALFGETTKSRQYGLGIEAAYLLATNLWVSAGYNWFGYHDEDLAAGEYTNRGPFVRLRYKFDEALFESAPAERKAP